MTIGESKHEKFDEVVFKTLSPLESFSNFLYFDFFFVFRAIFSYILSYMGKKSVNC